MRTAKRFHLPIVLFLLAALLPATGPVTAQQGGGNAFIQDKNVLSNTLNGLGVLQLSPAGAQALGQIVAIFDIAEAVEKAHHGEYNDAMAILLKLGMTTLFESTVGPMAAALDVGKLVRDATVKQVIDPRIEAHYQKYRALRIADLEADLNRKMIEYRTSDFTAWAVDMRGALVEEAGQDTVRQFINDELMADGQHSAYLYNVAQMRVQDAKHDKEPFVVKWWPRFYTSEKPMPFEDARTYWIQTWNARVVAEGLELTVKRRKEFVTYWSDNSVIRFLVEVDNPIEGLVYGLRCPELGWQDKGTVSLGADGNYVLFVKEIWMKEFYELQRKFAESGGFTFHLISSHGKPVATRFFAFADVMASRHALRRSVAQQGMYTEFRVPVRFVWRPELLKQLDIKIPARAKVDSICIRFRKESVTLQRKPEAGALPPKTLPLESHFSGGKIDLLSVLEASGLPREDALSCLYGTDTLEVSCKFSLPDPERDPQRDPPDKLREYSHRTALMFPEPVQALDYAFTPNPRPRIADAKERQEQTEKLMRAYIASPGDQPRDYFIYAQSLPLNGSWSGYEALARERVEREFGAPLTAFAKRVSELDAQVLALRAGDVVAIHKAAAALDGGALQWRVPIPSFTSMLKTNADEAKRKIAEARQRLADQVREAERLQTIEGEGLKAAGRQLGALNTQTGKLPLLLDQLDRLREYQEEIAQRIDEAERMTEYKVSMYGNKVARLANPAATASFYLSRVAELQKRRRILHDEAETLMGETVRQDDYVRTLVGLFQNFNAWAEGTDPHASCATLDRLYTFVTGDRGDPQEPKRQRAVPDMIAGIEAVMRKVMIPEIECLESTQATAKPLAYSKAVLAQTSDGLSPLMALFVQDIPESHIAQVLKERGRLDETALMAPVIRRINDVKQAWAAAEHLPAGSGRYPERTFWVRVASGAMDRFFTLTGADRMARGDDNARAWVTAYRALEAKAAQVGAKSHLQDALAWIKQSEQLSGELAKISTSRWPDRYEAERIAGNEFPRAGDLLARHLVAAWLIDMDTLDRKIRKELGALATLEPKRRQEETARLAAMADNTFWNALGLQPLAQTQLGKSIYIGCYAAHTTSELYIPLHQKWSRLTTSWRTALAETSAQVQAPAGQPTAPDVDTEVRPPPATQKQAHEQYVAAQNALARLMVAGKGGTPEGQEAYRAMRKAKEAYEASLK